LPANEDCPGAAEAKRRQSRTVPTNAANYALASQKDKFHYVYILRSLSDPERHYTGLTCNLDERLQKHNAGQVSHTSKFRPWQIETAVAFRSPDKAAAFERYLKSHSGRAFALKHF